MAPAPTPSGFPEAEKLIACEEHGAQRWAGDITCTKCGTVYPGDVLAVPDFCPSCRARLLPHDSDKTIKWWGVIACPECARIQLGR